MKNYFQNLFDEFPVSVFVLDSEWKILDLNNQALSLLNVDENDAKQEEFTSFFDAAASEKLSIHLRSLLLTGEAQTCEIDLTFDEGSKKNLLLNSVIKNFNEKDICLISVSEIGALKKREEKFLNEKAKLDSIFNNCSDGIISLDAELNITEANRSALSTLEYLPEDVVKLNISDIIEADGGDDLKIFDQLFKKRSSSGQCLLKSRFNKTTKMEYVTVPRYKGNKHLLFLQQEQKINYEEKLQYYISELENNNLIISKNAEVLSELNEKLVKSEKEREDLSVSKDKYFSIIAHDLRSPFASLYGFAEYLFNEFENLSKTELKEHFDNIYKSSKNVYNLLDNLLQWSRVQSGKIEYLPESINLLEKINSVVELYKVGAAKKKIELKIEVDSQINVYADGSMTETVLRNLISNAIKFSRRNSKVWISSSIKNGIAEICVEDQGVGISPAQLQTIFNLSKNKSTPGTEGEEGTGLGLLICDEFIKKNNGKIRVESDPQTGSSFYFSLPVSTK